MIERKDGEDVPGANAGGTGLEAEKITKERGMVRVADVESPKIPESFELSVCAAVSAKLGTVLSRFESQYGSQVYSREIIQGVRDRIPKLVTQEDLLSLIVENLLRAQELEHAKVEKARLLSTIEMLGRDEASVRVDSRGTVLDANERFLAISGYSREELIGQSTKMFNSGVHDQTFWQEFWTTISSGNVWEGNVCDKRKDGSLFWLHTIVSPVREGDEVVAYDVVSHDVTELEELRRKHHDLLLNRLDFLTGLPNRAKLAEDLSKNPLPTLAIVHINSLDEMNNAFGSKAGDSALSKIAEFLSSRFRSKGGAAYRLEGPDFAVTCAEPATDRSVAEFHEALKSVEIVCDNVRIPATFSIGVVSDGSSGDEMIARAHLALHQSKEYAEPVVFDGGLLSSATFREMFEMASLVKSAFKHDLFLPFYQGIRCNEDPEGAPLAKFECLIRMYANTEKETILPPSKFLPATKKNKDLGSITQVMMEKTFAFMADKKVPSFPGCPENRGVAFSLNLTERDVSNPSFVDGVKNMLSDYGIDPSRVTFEILEDVSSLRTEQIIATVRALKALGCRIAIDDFGTENAGFKRMIDFRPDFIKIDRGHVQNVHLNPENASLIQAIVGYANAVGTKVIAEGVETREEQNKLVELGVHYSQGYLFSVPSPRLY